MSHPKIKTRINIHMDNFDEHAKEVLKDVYQNNLNADVVIRSKSRKFPCHRLVLSFCSDFFKKILQETPYSNPWITPVIIIPDIEDDIIEYIVQFIYTGEIRVSEERFNEFLEACSLLQLKSMINYDYASRFEGDDGEHTQLNYQDTPLDTDEAMQVQIIGDYSDSEYQIVSQKDNTDMSGFEIEVIDHGNVMMASSTPFESKKRKRPYVKREPGTLMPNPVSVKRERALREEDPEYMENMKKAVNEVIQNKVSFQVASTKYNISKTHLWRICQSTPEYHLQRESAINPQLTQVIIEALKSGETLLSISKKYNVPVSTLHRRKSMLYEQGELPENVRIKQRNRGEDFGQRLELAINDIATMGISQTEAAKKYRIPKTTIWRRLKKLSGADQQYKTMFKTEGVKLEADEMAFELVATDHYQQADHYQQVGSNDEIIISESGDAEEHEIVAVGEVEDSGDIEMIADSEGEQAMKYIKLQNESDLQSSITIEEGTHIQTN